MMMRTMKRKVKKRVMNVDRHMVAFYNIVGKKILMKNRKCKKGLHKINLISGECVRCAYVMKAHRSGLKMK